MSGPTVGAVYVFDRRQRYIITKATRAGEDTWLLDLLATPGGWHQTDFAYHPSGGKVHFEPMTTDEQRLYESAVF